MCLIIKQRSEIAKEDIICYKVLERLLDTRTWRTPNGTKLPGFDAWRNCEGYVQEIREGDFPSFKKIDDSLDYPAIHSFASLNEPGINAIMRGPSMYQCCECVIPKGTKYYVGTVLYGNHWNNRWCTSKAYASERIIYKKLVDWNQIDKI